MNKIIELRAENFKRLQVVELSPDGTFNIVAGNNEQGKSSLLDAIAWAMAGKKAIEGTSEPIRKGQKKAEVTIDLGDLIVSRSITSAGERLQVSGKNGTPLKSPQAVLDALRGKISFDPLQFIQLSEAEQTKTLLSLVGVDIQSFEMERKELYDNRTIVNREVKQAKANLDSVQGPVMPEPYSIKSVDEITEKLVAMKQQQQQRLADQRNLQGLKTDFSEINEEIEDVKKNIEKLQAKVEALESKRNDIRERHNALAKALKENDSVNPDEISDIQSELKSVNEHNDNVRSYQAYEQLLKIYQDSLSKSETLSLQISELDNGLKDKISAAEMPITGLSVVDGIVRYNDTPISQCSQAVRIKISMAIAMAMNPRLRVILIREGAFFDTKNLAIIQDMAKDKDYQIWIERVGEGETGIIIENGEIKSTPKSKTKTTAPAPAKEDDLLL